MKKLLFSLMELVALVAVAGFASFAENKADIEGSKANTSYTTTTTSNGWVIANAAYVSIDGVYAPTLNGKTSAVGSITSPTLNDGLSQISFNYTNTYSESNGVSLRIDVKQDGKVVDSETLTNTNVVKGQVYAFESKAFNIAGDFQIVITNLSPSSSSSNKDRVSIWNLTWTNYAVASDKIPADLSFADTNYTATLGEEFASPELTKATTAEAVYSSSNEAVATVDAATGAVTLVAAGETTITATCDENDEYLAGEVSYTLTVLSNLKDAGMSFPESSYEVILGEEFTAPVLTKATTAEAVYSSGNPDVATVDATTGAVTILSVGEADIYANCAENDEYQAGEAKYRINVIEPVNENEIEEVLTNDSFSITGTSYKDVTYTSSLTGIVYKGQMAGGNNSIQLRSSNSNSGIVISENKNGYKVKSIEVEYNSATSGRTLDVYGKESAYTAPTDLYSASTQGTLEGSVESSNVKPVNFTDPALYFGVRSNNGALYIDKIIIIYEKPSGVILKEAELSFPEAAYSVTLGEEFTAPELTKATTADAVYSSSNEAVATVDAATGVVTLVAAGETTITATCAENEEYQGGEASYTLTVLSNLKEAGLEFTAAEYTVTLGEEFTAPELTKVTTAEAVYTSSDETVATVDAATGAVTLVAAGETTITATCAENEEYQAGEASYKLIVNEPVSENEIEEVLTIASFGTPSGTTYQDVTYTSAVTGIVYKGQMASNSGKCIQLRSTSPSGIVVNENKNGYLVKSIDIEYASNTADARVLDVYGKNSNYASAADLYNASSAGTKEGSIAKSDVKPVDFTEPALYFGVRSNSGAMYIDKITIIYEKPSGVILQEPALEFPATEYTATIGETFVAPELIKATTAEAVYSSSNEAVATVDATTGEVTLVSFGTTVITAECAENEEYRAGTASYTLTVDDPSVKVIYNNDLKSDVSEFTFQTNEGEVEPWSFDASFGMKATAYSGGNQVSDATAVSPVIDLTSYVAPIRASFQQAGNYFGSSANTVSVISDYCSVMVREADAAEFADKADCAMPTVNGFAWTASEVDLSAYAGKKIQLGFRYTSTADVCGTWEIKDMVIKGKEGIDTGVDAVATADADVVYYTLQGQRVVNPDKGVYIRVRGGKADKVMF